MHPFFNVHDKIDFFSYLESPDDLDSSMQKNNESHVSGISPFFSSEDINVSINVPPTNESVSTKCKCMHKQINSAISYGSDFR